MVKIGEVFNKMAKDEITDIDREYFGTDSKKFFERALLNARTWEEGTKYAKELRNLQHPSLSAVQSRSENVTAIELRWSRPSEVKSNELQGAVEPEKILIEVKGDADGK